MHLVFEICVNLEVMLSDSDLISASVAARRRECSAVSLSGHRKEST